MAKSLNPDVDRTPYGIQLPTVSQQKAAGAQIMAGIQDYAAQFNQGYAPSGTFAPTPVPAATGLDWQAYLGYFNLPPEVINQVSAIFQRTTDVDSATSQALAYIRGTDWYRQTYPGIQEAIAKGIVTDERQYRAGLNNWNQLYRQYTGRDITPGEYASFLREGTSIETAARRFQGAANVQAHGADWRYLSGSFGEGRLEAQDLQVLGEQTAGLSSNRGTMLEKLMRDAEQRMRRAFEGVLASPGLSTSRSGRLLASSFSGEPDVGR